MEAPMDITPFDHPIDAMYLIHKALRAEAERVEAAVDQLAVGGSFKPFQPAFYRWATALGYHVDVEEKHVTNWLPDTLLTQAGTTGRQHVMELLEELQTYLHTDLSRTLVIPRTQRQLRLKVIALRLVQEDLLEEEEERVLPVLRQYMSAAQQLALIQRLLIDEEAEEQRAMLDWVAQDLTTTERQWLAGLDARFTTVPVV